MSFSSRTSLFAALLAVGSFVAVACTGAEPERVLPSGGQPQVDASVQADADASGRVRPTNPTLAAPEVTALVPAEAPLGGPEVVISVEGSGFIKESFVELEGTALPTSYETPARLTTAIPASALKKATTLKVTVNTPNTTSGDVRSNVVTFAVLNPTPTLTALSPSSTLAATSTTGTGLSLLISGSGFSESAIVNFGTLALTPTIVAVDSVRVTVPLTALTNAGSVPVTVSNPAPGGGASSSIAFTITNPNVTLSKCTPTSITVGASTTALSIEGVGFVTGSKVSFNGSDIATTYVSSTKLTASVPSTALTTTGAFPVSVTNPSPGGGVSSPLTVSVVNPSPTVSVLSPSSATAGASATAVTLTGTGFVSSSRVRFDGTEATTTYVSSTSLKATLSATQLASAKTITVTVLNPAPGGGTSSSQSLTVANPVPVWGSVAPSSAFVGALDTTITVTGSKFVSTSIVQADATDLATVYKSATELSAKIPASKLLTTGSISIRVRTPSPGGGTSSSGTFTISATPSTCTSTGVDYPITSASSVTVPFSFVYGPLTPFKSTNSTASSYTCPLASLDTNAEAQNFGFAVVQNATASPMYLSAEAVCSAVDDDAFMVFYRNSTTSPMTDTELKNCSGYVAEGASGSGGRTSSINAGGSSYCPGLTVANGGAIKLDACEKLVIVMQPYYYPTFPTPTSAKVTLSKP